MALIQTLHPNRIALYVGKQEVRSGGVGVLNPVFEKSAAEPKPKACLLRSKNIVNIETFNMRILNTIN